MRSYQQYSRNCLVGWEVGFSTRSHFPLLHAKSSPQHSASLEQFSSRGMQSKLAFTSIQVIPTQRSQFSSDLLQYSELLQEVRSHELVVIKSKHPALVVSKGRKDTNDNNKRENDHGDFGLTNNTCWNIHCKGSHCWKSRASSP